jgi:hypothetical protein
MNFNAQIKDIWVAKGSKISEIKKIRRAARSIPRPLGRGGRAQFDMQRVKKDDD